MADAERMYFVDNLKVALTVLVIAHHVGQAYGPTGGWWPIQESARADVLGPLFTVDRSFFMSLFFLISGYLMVASYDRHGPATFLRSRLVRLGVPLVLFFFLVIPVQQYLCHRWTTDIAGLSFARYYVDFYFGFGERPAGWTGPAWPELNFGHLWYVEHLLILSVLYAILRVVFKRPVDADRARRADCPDTEPSSCLPWSWRRPRRSCGYGRRSTGGAACSASFRWSLPTCRAI